MTIKVIVKTAYIKPIVIAPTSPKKQTAFFLILKYPDAVFPNNWFSVHKDGTKVLYPMFAKSRRKERVGVGKERVEVGKERVEVGKERVEVGKNLKRVGNNLHQNI